MSSFPNDPFLVYKRKGDRTDPFLQYNEPKQVYGGKVVLTEIPDKGNHITVKDSNNISYAEVYSQASLSANNVYYVDYDKGIVYFDASKEGLTFTFSYLGIGGCYIPATRVYTQSLNGTITQDVQDMIDNYNQLNGTDLYNLFDPQTGHKHTGGAGDAPAIDSQYVTYNNGSGTVSKVKDTLDSHAAQLADIPNQTYITEKAKTVDVTNSLALKRDKAILLTMNDMGQDVKTSMTGGSVAVVGANAVQTINILDNAVTTEKVSYITKSPQIYDWKNDTGLTKDYRVSTTDGTLFSATGYSATGYIPVSPSRNLVYGDQKGTGGSTLISLNNSAVYDANKVFIVGYGGGDSGVVHALPSNAAYIRKSFNGNTSNAVNLGVFYDQVSTDFNFWRKLDNTKVEIPNADYATSAGSATSATNATNATNWTNLPSLYNYSFNRYNYKTTNLEQQLSTTTGQINSHSGLAVSDYCELTSTNKVYLGYQGTSAYQSSFANVVLYDQNKTMIQVANTLSDYTVDTSVTPNMINFTPPSNAKYIRFQMQQGYGVYDFYKQVYVSQGSKPTLFNFNNFYYEVIKDSSSKWVGKKIVAYGDSTSAGTSYSTLTWLGKVCAKLQTIPVNRAIGGSTVNDDPTRIAWVSDGTTDPTNLGPYGEYVSRPSSLDDGSGTGALSSTQPSGTVQIDSSMCTDGRVNTIPTDADVIVILAGTNGMDQTSYDTMLQKIFTRCPNAIIMCCSLTFRYNDSTYSTITDVSGSNSIIQNLCEIYGCHYIDLKGIECINQFNHGTYMIDNVHANDAGNERRARVIAKAIQLIEPLS